MFRSHKFPRFSSRRAVVRYWLKYMHEVLVNRLGGLSLHRKSVVRLTDCPDMTLDVYRGRKTTQQQYTDLMVNGYTLRESSSTTSAPLQSKGELMQYPRRLSPSMRQS